jgi:hypothetical protein
MALTQTTVFSFTKMEMTSPSLPITYHAVLTKVLGLSASSTDVSCGSARIKYIFSFVTPCFSTCLRSSDKHESFACRVVALPLSNFIINTSRVAPVNPSCLFVRLFVRPSVCWPVCLFVMSGDNDSKSLRFEPLDDGGNYPEWSIRMEAELTRRGLLEVVVFENAEGDPAEVAKAKEAWMKKRTAKRMAEAQAEIILRVKDSQLAHVRDHDPMAIWEKLAQIHIAHGFATRLALRRKFLRLVKDRVEPMSAWIGRVKALAFKLEDVGVVVTDEDRILALTNGLDSSYESFVISLDATSAEQLNLEYVVDRLLNEEVRQSNKEVVQERVMQERVSLGEGSALTVTGQGPGGRPPSRNMDGPTCWRCGESGHIRAFCKKVPQGGENGMAHVAIGLTNVSQLRDLGEQHLGQLY